MELWRERALVLIIYLIIKIVIIDWSKLNHVTRRKSTYHCLEGLGSTPNLVILGRVTPPRLLHTHIIVASQWLQCRAALYAHWVLLCRAEFQCNSL